MKKIVYLITALVLTTLVFTACGNNDAEKEIPEDTQKQDTSVKTEGLTEFELDNSVIVATPDGFITDPYYWPEPDSKTDATINFSDVTRDISVSVGDYHDKDDYSENTFKSVKQKNLGVIKTDTAVFYKDFDKDIKSHMAYVGVVNDKIISVSLTKTSEPNEITQEDIDIIENYIQTLKLTQ